MKYIIVLLINVLVYFHAFAEDEKNGDGLHLYCPISKNFMVGGAEKYKDYYRISTILYNDGDEPVTVITRFGGLNDPDDPGVISLNQRELIFSASIGGSKKDGKPSIDINDRSYVYKKPLSKMWPITLNKGEAVALPQQTLVLPKGEPFDIEEYTVYYRISEDWGNTYDVWSGQLKAKGKPLIINP